LTEGSTTESIIKHFEPCEKDVTLVKLDGSNSPDSFTLA
jgi:hypothetical protein